MKIERLSECSVKITLTENDMSDYGIKYDNWDNKSAAGFLLSVSDEIKRKTGTDITREKLYVEIFSQVNSCLIFVSFPVKTKRCKCRLACTFSDFDSLKNFCLFLQNRFPEYTGSSCLYYSSSALRLVLEIPSKFREFIENMTENGYISECDPITNASTAEYYTCAVPSNAAAEIVKL